MIDSVYTHAYMYACVQCQQTLALAGYYYILNSNYKVVGLIIVSY